MHPRVRTPEQCITNFNINSVLKWRQLCFKIVIPRLDVIKRRCADKKGKMLLKVLEKY